MTIRLHDINRSSAGAFVDAPTPMPMMTQKYGAPNTSDTRLLQAS
jgi:hypothetical protein